MRAKPNDCQAFALVNALLSIVVGFVTYVAAAVIVDVVAVVIDC